MEPSAGMACSELAHLQLCQQGAHVLVNSGAVLDEKVGCNVSQAELLLSPLHVCALVLVYDPLQLHHLPTTPVRMHPPTPGTLRCFPAPSDGDTGELSAVECTRMQTLPA